MFTSDIFSLVSPPNPGPPISRLLACLAGVALVAGAVGCSASTSIARQSPSPPTTSVAPTTTVGPTHIGTLTQSPSECNLDAVDSPISPGRVAFTAVNETDALAAFHMWRIADGYTYDQLAAHIVEERRLAEAGEPRLGHPSFVGDLIEIVLQARESGTMVGTVRSGTYGIVCIRMFQQTGEARPFGVIGPVEVK